MSNLSEGQMSNLSEPKRVKAYGSELQAEWWPWGTAKELEETGYRRSSTVINRHFKADGAIGGSRSRPNDQHLNFGVAVARAMPEGECTACINNAAAALGRLLHLAGGPHADNPFKMLIDLVNRLMARSGFPQITIQSSFGRGTHAWGMCMHASGTQAALWKAELARLHRYSSRPEYQETLQFVGALCWLRHAGAAPGTCVARAGSP